MRGEKYIEEKVGKRNPFQVPEGYFEQFASQLMQKGRKESDSKKP